ncbi:ATP/GTP-binding protein [Streptomyces sp. TRM68367]|uniref:ATP/GTP-binding protein n=1 Tax=Streptomyces sp. TRM68367 TaxID=2758415 RepID=UPI0029347A99|nr:ATP/GTP-binding protein [Streptomyces sp. TRM68367]
MNDRSVEAEEAFTNRQAQWQAIVAALTDHLHRVANPGFDVEDLAGPRHNILVGHGVGGIGKSTFSRKIEASLAHQGGRPAQWDAPSWPIERILPVRIDLARSTGIDFERVVLSIRLAIAALGRPMPAFDLALRRHWERNHPGEPLEEYLRRGGLFSRFTNAVNLPQQMQSALADVAQALAMPGTVGGAVGQLTTTLVGALRERRQTVRALAGCARLADILEAEPDLETLSFATHLLAWDLAQLPATQRVVPVILFDTFEDVGDRTNRDLERLLQRIVWLMPQAFFVITGRNRLQWAEEGLAGQLDWTGPTAWPGLAGHVPASRGDTGPAGRQILLGDFSPEDCDDHLARRLSRDGQPLIGEDLRHAIAARSHGLPLYLDLAVMRFVEIRRSGREPQPADFGDFPALISRTVSDLTTDERHVLRSVSLLDAFSVPLATQIAGLTHDAAALRLTERPFIREDPAGLWPFHLHQVVRSAIRHAEDHTDDRWSEQDWHRAATRALAALGHEWRHGPRRDRTMLIGCLRQGLRLAHDHRLDDLDWLTDAAFAYTEDSVWEPLAPPTHTPPPPPGTEPQPGPDTPSDALAELLATIARRQHEHRERTAERLTAVLTTGLLSGEIAELALYYRAKAHKDLGRTDAALDGYRQVADADNRLAPRARRGLANLARIRGDFEAALAAVPTLGWKGRHHRVLGHIHFPHGDIDRAVAAFEDARTEAEQHDAPGERAIAQTLLALACAFTDPLRADDELTLAHQLLAQLDQRATTLLAQVAALVRDAGTDRDLTDRATVLRTEISVAGLAWLTPLLETALAFHHAVRGAQDDLTTTIGRLREATANGDFAYFVHIATAMGDLPQPTRHPIQWLDGEPAVRTRWRALVTARQHHLRN